MEENKWFMRKLVVSYGKLFILSNHGRNIRFGEGNNVVVFHVALNDQTPQLIRFGHNLG